MGRDIVALTVGLLAGVVALVGCASMAHALSPAPPPAEIVFSNGGRILSMKVDGSDRQVLFGKNRNPKNDELGAVDPAVSPDRSTVAFGFRRKVRGRMLTDVWRVGRDGSGAKRVLVSKPKLSYGDPTFSAEGVLVAAFFQKRAGFTRTGLVSVGLGGETRTIFELREKRRPFRQPVTVAEPDFSRVGKKVLYVLVNGAEGDYSDDGFRNALMVRNLETGRIRKLADDAYDGAWSRGGNLVVYSAQTKNNDLHLCWWISGCTFQSSLVRINGDGTRKQALTNPRLDARSPNWSYDNRVVFQSARNLPSVGEATEIYSIDASGRCLTMLTNGSPASVSPVWGDGAIRTSASVKCGATPPGPNVEVKSPPGRPGKFWFGERFGTRLLSDSAGSPSLLLYQDCDRLLRSECRKPMLLINSDVCRTEGQVASFASGYLRRQRGVPVFISRGAEIGDFVIVWTGRSISYFVGGSGKGKVKGTFEVAGLRNIGGELSSDDLPPPRVPAADVKMAKRVKASYKSTGSITAAARRLGMRPVRVRQNLKFSRLLERLGPFESLNCRKKESASGTT